ncbi:MAG: NAD(P)/FAD-dependent oxidoreductase [Eubacteriales bacterium]
MRYVIIGNSHAAVGAIEGIRSVDQTGEIVVISKEPHPVYGRPLISYYLCGKTTLEKMAYRPADFYEKNGVTLLLGKTAVKADPESKSVTLDDGSVVLYDKLLFACGSNPTIIPFEGLDGVKNKFTFTTLDDALALEQVLTPESRVLIIGAGLIGLKCAEGIYGRVADITVCDLADRVLPTILDEECAAPVAKVLADAGIAFLPGDTVAKFEGNTAHMKSGTVLDFDILVMAIGVRPNTALAKEMGASVNRGILIDSGSRTDLPDVYAAGDCAEGYDASLGDNRVLAILPSAYLEGHAAGVNMAGGTESLDNDIPMNSIGFFGLHIISAGSYTGECRTVGSGAFMKRFYVSGNRLNGFIAIGDTDRAGIYTSLIRNKVDLSTVDFEGIMANPGLIAFDRQARDAKLAKPV